jgi:hypothetical protein
MDLLNHPKLNHHVAVVSGILAAEAAAFLVGFFAKKRAEGHRH